MDQIENHNDHRPVVWTPEDAANFLSMAIKEAQKPLTTALSRRGVPLSVFAMMTVVVIAAGVGIFFFLREERQDMRELRNEAAVNYRAREDVVRLEAELDAMRARLTDSETSAAAAKLATERVRSELAATDAMLREARKRESHEKELRQEIAVLQKQVEPLKHEARKAIETATERSEEAALARKQSRLMQAQLDGLMEEKEALSKQLSVTRQLVKVLQDGKPEEKPFTPEAKPEVEAKPESPVEETSPDKEKKKEAEESKKPEAEPNTDSNNETRPRNSAPAGNTIDINNHGFTCANVTASPGSAGL